MKTVIVTLSTLLLMACAGKDGANGHNGVSGGQGIAGQQGETGATGQDGSPGLDGAQGPQGVAGNDGAQGPTGATGAVGPQGIQGATGDSYAGSIPEAVSSVAAEFPTNINPGINCTLQQVTSGQYLSSSSPGYTAAAGVLALTGSAKAYTNMNGFDQPSVSSGTNSIVSSNYQYLLPLWNNYKVVCTGFLIVTTAATYDFTVSSDDGSIVSVSGLGSSYTLNNDGTHGMQTASTSTGTWLYPGVYNITVQYAQSGGGSWGLILSWVVNNVPSVIPAANFYH